MAIIVDKEQKKQDIALSCRELFAQNKIGSLTMLQIAKEAGVGKGTLYEYFKNKEEILFEIASVLMQKNEDKLLVEIANLKTTKEKIKKFYEFFCSEEDAELREIYKEFVSITLVNPSEEMIDFQTQANTHFFALFRKIIQEGIDTKELVEESIDLSRGMLAVGKGMFMQSETTKSIENLKSELTLYLDTIFKLIEVKK